MVTHEFRAMGTRFAFVVDGPAGDGAGPIADAERVVHRLEARLSRFRPDSELSRLNRAGRARVGDDLRAVTRLALDGRDDTGGRFDPTVGVAVVAAGYDRSFDELATDVGPTAPPVRHDRSVVVDDTLETITLGAGVALDLGGIAKGYAAEMAAAVLHDAGPCLVNAGGDIATRGTPASGAWAVGVPTADGEVTVGLRGGAMATSGRDRRVWLSAGTARHHIIDPRTDHPAQSDVVRLTVVGQDAVEAETLATALFMVGGDAAIDEARSLGVPLIVVTEAGHTLTTGVAA